jgi:cytidine deaminase
MRLTPEAQPGQAAEPAWLAALWDAARQVRVHAHAPYSRFAVGAAVLDEQGRVHAGCNVENAAYPSGICAETAAIAAMVCAGEREIAAILVLGEGAEPLPPCGACRQRILEFSGPQTRIYCGGASGPGEALTMAELLPHAFGPGRLGRTAP